MFGSFLSEISVFYEPLTEHQVFFMIFKLRRAKQHRERTLLSVYEIRFVFKVNWYDFGRLESIEFCYFSDMSSVAITALQLCIKIFLSSGCS